MKTIQLTLLAGLAGAASLSAFEGGYDYKDLLKNGGTFHNDSSNSLVQKARFYGRFQYQYSTGSTDNGGTLDRNSIRRSRLGAEVKFLNYFKFKGNTNWALDDGIVTTDDEGGYKGWDDAGISADLQGLFDISYFDELSLGLGRHKVKMGHDVHTSSKKIAAVERTRFTDGYLRPENLTGLWLKGEKAGIDFTVALLNNAFDEEGGWDVTGDDMGQSLYLSSKFKAAGGKFYVDFLKGLNDISDRESKGSVSVGQELDYGFALAYEKEIAGVNYVAQFGAGEGDGEVMGFGLQATKFVTDNLQLVGRVYNAQGDDKTLSVSRAVNKTHGTKAEGITSVYVGANYYFIGHNSKVMLGAELEQYDDASDNADSGTSFYAAYRMSF